MPARTHILHGVPGEELALYVKSRKTECGKKPGHGILPVQSYCNRCHICTKNFFNGARDGAMNKIKIMEDAVKKWQKIIDKKGSDGGVLDCPPCRIYYFTLCLGCPIAQYSGKKFCKGTAYIPWFRHQLEKHDKLIKKVYCPECEKLARDMQNFMIEIRDHLIERKARKKGK